MYILRRDNPNPIWGALTVGLTFVPAILGFLVASTQFKYCQRLMNFVCHLPGIQIITHLYYQWKIIKNQHEVKKIDREILEAKEENNTDQVKRLESEKNATEIKVYDGQSKLNEFKAKEAFGESFPQTILQLTIVLKDNIKKMANNLTTVSAIVTSILSLLFTLTSLSVSLPLYISLVYTLSLVVSSPL